MAIFPSSTDLAKINVFWQFLILVAILFAIELFCKYLEKKKPKLKLYADVLIKSIHNYKIRSIRNPLYTILIPVLVMAILNFALFRTPDASVVKNTLDLNPLILIFIVIIFQPILEEIVFRGFIFGAFLSYAETLKELRYKFNPLYSKIIVVLFPILGFFTQLFFFIISHGIILYSLIINGLIYSILYILNKKKLLPSIVAHMANNLFITLIVLLTL